MSSNEGDISPPSSQLPTEEIDNEVVLSTTPQRIFKNNPDRIAVIFSNLTSIEVSVYTKAIVSSTLGYALDSAGGLLNFKSRDEGRYATKEWWAVAASGTPTITVTEIAYKKRQK